MTLQEFKPAYFSIEDRDSVLVATVTRPTLCEEDNIEQFGVELSQVTKGSGSYLLVLDLSQVTLMTSSAIGKLIGLHRNLHRREGRLVLSGITSMIRRVLSAAKLVDYFHISTTVDAAVELLKRDSSSSDVATVCKPR
jgi:anti-sigma B factor antagonist